MNLELGDPWLPLSYSCGIGYTYESNVLFAEGCRIGIFIPKIMKREKPIKFRINNETNFNGLKSQTNKKID